MACVQVMALCQAPFLMDDPKVSASFPPDAVARAKKYLAMTSGGVGALSEPPLVFRPSLTAWGSTVQLPL